MITYSSIALKDDKEFIKAAKKILRGEFDLVINDARKAMERAHSECTNDLHKINSARRAANLVILDAIKQFGVTNWRELDQDKPIRQVNYEAKPPTPERKKKWEGKSILDMADENLAKRKS